MKSFFLGWLLLAISFAGIGADAGKAQPPAVPQLEGSWSGVLPMGRDQVRLTVKIFRSANGQMLGSVTGVPGNDVIAVDSVEQSGDKVKLVVGAIGGGFEAMFSDDRNKLTGTWSEIAITTPLELVRLPASPAPAATTAPH